MAAAKIKRYTIALVSRCLMLTLLLLNISAHCDESAKPGVKLPGIYSVWKTETDDKPSITMEDLQKCMSHDIKFQQEYDILQNETKTMDAEIVHAEQLVKNNQSDRKLIEEEVSKLKEDQSSLVSRGELLNQKKTELEKLTTKKVDAATAKSINAQINQFNKDIHIQNETSSKLNERAQAFMVKQKSFNTDLESLKVTLDQINEKTLKFNERKKLFDTKISAHKDQCEGQRKLEKKD